MLIKYLHFSRWPLWVRVAFVVGIVDLVIGTSSAILNGLEASMGNPNRWIWLDTTLLPRFIGGHIYEAFRYFFIPGFLFGAICGAVLQLVVKLRQWKLPPEIMGFVIGFLLTMIARGLLIIAMNIPIGGTSASAFLNLDNSSSFAFLQLLSARALEFAEPFLPSSFSLFAQNSAFLYPALLFGFLGLLIGALSRFWTRKKIVSASPEPLS